MFKKYCLVIAIGTLCQLALNRHLGRLTFWVLPNATINQMVGNFYIVLENECFQRIQMFGSKDMANVLKVNLDPARRGRLWHFNIFLRFPFLMRFTAMVKVPLCFISFPSFCLLIWTPQQQTSKVMQETNGILDDYSQPIQWNFTLLYSAKLLVTAFSETLHYFIQPNSRLVHSFKHKITLLSQSQNYCIQWNFTFLYSAKF